MKVCLVFLLLGFGLISCQSSIVEKQSMEAYKAGIEVLQQASDNQREANTKALEYFNAAVTANPGNMEAAHWKSQVELKLGKFSNALQTANVAIEKIKDDNHRLLPNFYMVAGIAERREGNQILSQQYFQWASDIYGQRIKKDNNDTDAIGNRALALCYMGRKRDAITFLDNLTVSRDNQVLIQQIKEDIADFDADKALEELIIKEK